MRLWVSFLLLSSFVLSVTSIKCYVCNSLMNKDCEDNYEKLQQWCPVKSFGGKKAIKPIGCRLSKQYVQSENSIVRECAYIGQNEHGKSHKGSLGVSRVINQCDVDLCNEGSSFQGFLVLPALVLAILKL